MAVCDKITIFAVATIQRCDKITPRYCFVCLTDCKDIQIISNRDILCVVFVNNSLL